MFGSTNIDSVPSNPLLVPKSSSVMKKKNASVPMKTRQSILTENPTIKNTEVQIERQMYFTRSKTDNPSRNRTRNQQVNVSSFSVDVAPLADLTTIQKLYAGKINVIKISIRTVFSALIT